MTGGELSILRGSAGAGEAGDTSAVSAPLREVSIRGQGNRDIDGQIDSFSLHSSTCVSQFEKGMFLDLYVLFHLYSCQENMYYEKIAGM